MSWHWTLRNIPNGISLGSLWSVNKLVLLKELTQMLLCLLLGLWSKVLTFITIAFSSFRWRGLDLDNLGLSLRALPSLILLLHLIDFIEGCCNRVCELLLRRRVPHQTWGNETWLLSLSLCEHWNLSCSDETSSLSLSIRDLHNSLRRCHLRWVKLSLLQSTKHSILPLPCFPEAAAVVSIISESPRSPFSISGTSGMEASC